MFFRTPNKRINECQIYIDNTKIECVSNFNFLGIIINENMSWKSHTIMLASKISRTIGILNKLKFLLPTNIKLMLYNSLILCRLTYGILLWGFECNRISKLQKRAIRLIVSEKYNAHTEPIFKSLSLLKLEDIFYITQLKFYYQMINKSLPHYFW